MDTAATCALATEGANDALICIKELFAADEACNALCAVKLARETTEVAELCKLVTKAWKLAES